MQTIDYQKLMGGGGSPSYPPKDVIDVKVKWYSRRYWHCEPPKTTRMQRTAMVFVLVNYFEYAQTDCAKIFNVHRSNINRDLVLGGDIVLRPSIFGRDYGWFVREIRRIYYYIK